MKFVFIFLISLNQVFAQESYSTYLTVLNIKWCDLPQVTRGEETFQDHTIVINYQKYSTNASILRLKLRTHNQFSYNCESHYNNLLNEITKHGGSMPITIHENANMEEGCRIIELESEILGIKYFGRTSKCSDD